MLSLLDPVEFENAFIFRDDVDPRKFYPLPDKVVILPDDRGNPEFLFIKYIKDVDELADTDKDIGGGIVQIRTSLTMDPERREKIIGHLREQLQQEKAAGRKPFGHPIDTTEPLLAEPLWTSGKVSLATFKVSDNGLVHHATDGAPVNLAGGLDASVSLDLDPTGAEIFWSAYEDGKIPIMVTYQLKYRARVSASMTIHADRQLIQQKILEQARPYILMQQPFLRYVPLATSQPFAMAQLPALRKVHGAAVMPMIPRQQIQDTIHQSIVKNEIKVSITSDEGSSAQGADARDAMFKLATQMLSDRVVPALFGDKSSQPGASNADQSHPNVDLVQVQEAAAGGNISFDLSFDHQATKDDCEVNPNGPIQVLIANDEVRKRCFKQLHITDGFFHAMNVTASTSGVNFKADGVDTVHVFLKYAQTDDTDPGKPRIVRTKDGVLKSEQDAIHWRFDRARNADHSPKKTYSYMTEVFYLEGPSSRSDWAQTDTDKLLITPRAMGALRVELQLTAPESEVSSAKVLLEHHAESGQVFKTSVELTQKDPKKTWFQYTGELTRNDSDINPPEYTYQVIYRVAGAELTMPPARSNAKILEIPRPFTKTLKFTLLPQGSFDGVRDISGDFRYQDEQHHYSFIQSFQLTSLASSIAISVPVLEGGPEKARWQARVNRSDGSSVDLGSGDAVQGIVPIGRDSVLKVDFNTDNVNFEKDIQLAVVVMRYNDPSHNISERKTFTFSKSTKAQQSWIVNRVAGGPAKYDADIRFIAYDRSKNKEIKLNQIDDDLLLLDPAGQP